MKKCHLCQQDFNDGDVISLEGLDVCAGCKPEFLRRMQEGDLESAYYHYAGFWIRVVAKMIDGLILFTVTFPIGLLTAMISEGFIKDSTSGKGLAAFFILQGINMVIGFLIGLTYSASFLATKGATPGKMACGIRVINADGTLKISLGKAIGRGFAEILSQMILYIGYLMVAWDSEKRALHDHICNTRVIYKK